ncbi:hypothetical protein, partial [Salmonella sp. s51228]|uniref:hypothetical protein n=1 Tax=Salmonella sp. s51228 TaxID=3159652 RepID=UPI0039818BD4
EVKLTQEVPEQVTVHSLRTSLVQKTHKALDLIGSSSKCEDGRKIIQDLITEISTSPVVKTNKFVPDLLKDVTVQVSEAISREDWYKKWGKHYLLSLTRAHLLQQSTNFKDPGLQHYGGNLFGQVRDGADEIFIKMPPPKPTIKPTTAVSAPLTSMHRYHSRGAPCFSGDSKVL